jgi:hypothetical protein
MWLMARDMSEIEGIGFIPPEVYDTQAFWNGWGLASKCFSKMRELPNNFFYPGMESAAGIVAVHSMTPFLPETIRAIAAEARFKEAVHFRDFFPKMELVNPEKESRLAVSTYLANINAGIAGAYDAIFNPSKTPVKSGDSRMWQTDRRNLEDFRGMVLGRHGFTGSR